MRLHGRSKLVQDQARIVDEKIDDKGGIMTGSTIYICIANSVKDY